MQPRQFVQQLDFLDPSHEALRPVLTEVIRNQLGVSRVHPMDDHGGFPQNIALVGRTDHGDVIKITKNAHEKLARPRFYHAHHKFADAFLDPSHQCFIWLDTENGQYYLFDNADQLELFFEEQGVEGYWESHNVYAVERYPMLLAEERGIAAITTFILQQRPGVPPEHAQQVAEQYTAYMIAATKQILIEENVDINDLTPNANFAFDVLGNGELAMVSISGKTFPRMLIIDENNMYFEEDYDRYHHMARSAASRADTALRRAERDHPGSVPFDIPEVEDLKALYMMSHNAGVADEFITGERSGPHQLPR